MTDTYFDVSVRAALTRWFVPILLLLVTVTAGSGYVVYEAHVDGAETVVEEQTTGTWTVESDFAHQTTITRTTSVFEQGERLENRPLYFTSVMPRLNGTYTISHVNTDGNAANASIDLSLVIRSVGQSDGEDVVFWQTKDTLRTLDAVEIEDGTTTARTVRVDVPTILNRTESIRKDLAAAPGETEVQIQAESEIESTVAGETFTDTRTDSITISPGEAVYRVDTTVQDDGSYSANRQVARTIDPSRIALYGGPLVFVIALSSVSFLVVGTKNGLLAVSDREQRRSAFENARKDYDEWISAVSIPDSDDRTVIPADTLSDLVDIAIDSDRRVLEDDDWYAVLVDDIRYTYRAPSAVEPLDSVDSQGSTNPSRRPDEWGAPDSPGDTDETDTDPQAEAPWSESDARSTEPTARDVSNTEPESGEPDETDEE